MSPTGRSPGVPVPAVNCRPSRSGTGTDPRRAAWSPDTPAAAPLSAQLVHDVGDQPDRARPARPVELGRDPPAPEPAVVRLEHPPDLDGQLGAGRAVAEAKWPRQA